MFVDMIEINEECIESLEPSSLYISCDMSFECPKSSALLVLTSNQFFRFFLVRFFRFQEALTEIVQLIRIRVVELTLSSMILTKLPLEIEFPRLRHLTLSGGEAVWPMSGPRLKHILSGLEVLTVKDVSSFLSFAF